MNFVIMPRKISRRGLPFNAISFLFLLRSIRVMNFHEKNVLVFKLDVPDPQIQ